MCEPSKERAKKKSGAVGLLVVVGGAVFLHGARKSGIALSLLRTRLGERVSGRKNVCERVKLRSIFRSQQTDGRRFSNRTVDLANEEFVSALEKVEVSRNFEAVTFSG